MRSCLLQLSTLICRSIIHSIIATFVKSINQSIDQWLHSSFFLPSLFNLRLLNLFIYIAHTPGLYHTIPSIRSSHPSTHPPTNHLPTCPSARPSIHPSIHPSDHICINRYYAYICKFIHGLPLCPSILPSILLSMHSYIVHLLSSPSIHPYIHSSYPFTYPSVNLFIHLFANFPDSPSLVHTFSHRYLLPSFLYSSLQGRRQILQHGHNWRRYISAKGDSIVSLRMSLELSLWMSLCSSLWQTAQNVSALLQQPNTPTQLTHRILYII